MIFPSKKEYVKKALSHNLIPVYKEFIADTETPASIFNKAGGMEKEGFLLESIEGAKSMARFSFIGIGYNSRIRFSDGTFLLDSNNNRSLKLKTAFPLNEIKKIMEQHRPCKIPELDHFIGGAVGFLSYDLVKYFDDIQLPGESTGLPEIVLFLTDLVIVFDHMLNRMKIISTIKIDENIAAEKAYNMSVEKIEDIENRVFGGTSAFKQDFRSRGFDYSGVHLDEKFDIESNFARERFIKSVERAKKYIINGDAFQIVLSQRFSIKYNSSPFNIYRVLRTINPSPYMYYLNCGGFKIIGASPEPLLKISGRKVSTYPIAGTRKRGKSKSEDRYLANELLKDDKEKAEHNMLVDLARNDLGRFCRFGSVRVSKYMYIEKYSHVMHLVSRVEGFLDRNKTIYDALKSVFPAGTLTGAPKIRAMQIISELEPDRRGPYGGVVGYFGYNGDLDTCITIRTAVLKGNTVHIQSGAGIVYDSIPEKEREETINKAGALLKSIRLIE
jgi:anthranilate synthase component 1